MSVADELAEQRDRLLLEAGHRRKGTFRAVAVPALALSAVRKRYGRTEALAGVDLEVGEGELVGLLGPNGAGKSTLTKIACGLVRPTDGHRDGLRSPGRQRARARARPATSRSCSASPAGRPPTSCSSCTSASRAPAAARPSAPSCSSSSASPRRPRGRVEAMSKGMQQRLGIAQALIGAPRLVLLDEPTSALDPAGRRLVRGILEGLRGRGIAVLLNSHLLSEVELVCDRVVIIARGRTVTEGAPDDARRARAAWRSTSTAGRAASPTRGATTCPRSSRGSSRRASAIYGVRVVRGTLEDAYLEAVEGSVTADLRTIAGYALREALRRRVLDRRRRAHASRSSRSSGSACARRSRSRSRSARCPTSRRRPSSGATLVGLAMFVTLFLGTVLAVFLTLSAVRGDAERGLLQPLVVRPDRPHDAARSRASLAASRRLRRLRRARLRRRGRHHRRDGRTGGPSNPVLVGAGAGRGGASWSSRSRCSARRSSPRPPTASPSSWSSAPASRPGCSGRSARRWAPRRCDRHRVDRLLGAAVRGALPVGAAHADGRHLRA